MFTASLKGTFLEQLKARAEKWAGKKIAARIRVPEELKWWYWQEYGTAPYPIDPVEAKQLVFPQGGEIQFRDHVDHPGIKPRRIVTQALPAITEEASRLVDASFQLGAADNPQKLQAAVVEAVEAAKQTIVDAMVTALPGTRPPNPEHPKQGGKLGGRTASEVFNEQSSVVDLSE